MGKVVRWFIFYLEVFDSESIVELESELTLPKLKSPIPMSPPEGLERSTTNIVQWPLPR